MSNLVKRQSEDKIEQIYKVQKIKSFEMEFFDINSLSDE